MRLDEGAEERPELGLGDLVVAASGMLDNTPQRAGIAVDGRRRQALELQGGSMLVVKTLETCEFFLVHQVTPCYVDKIHGFYLQEVTWWTYDLLLERISRREAALFNKQLHGTSP